MEVPGLCTELFGLYGIYRLKINKSNFSIVSPSGFVMYIEQNELLNKVNDLPFSPKFLSTCFGNALEAVLVSLTRISIF